MAGARFVSQMNCRVSDRPVLLAVTGASGSMYALKFLEIMDDLGQDVHLVISDTGLDVCRLELGGEGLDRLRGLASVMYDVSRFDAAPASGSTRWRAMVILPCTMGTLAAIAGGVSQNLIHRSADCFLKERRTLVAVVRETPLNRIHLKNLLSFSDAGGIVYPAMPSFYSRPADLEEMAAFFAGRLAEFLGFEIKDLPVWHGRP